MIKSLNSLLFRTKSGYIGTWDSGQRSQARTPGPDLELNRAGSRALRFGEALEARLVGAHTLRQI